MKARKEITLAVIIGLILALVIAGGVYRAKTAIQHFDPQSLIPNSQPKSSSNPGTSTAQKLFLELDTPDNSVTTDSGFQLSGKTLPGTYIAITTESTDYLIVPNDLGTFSQEITLIKGANNIHVTVFDSQGNKVEGDRSVVYTTQQL